MNDHTYGAGWFRRGSLSSIYAMLSPAVFCVEHTHMLHASMHGWLLAGSKPELVMWHPDTVPYLYHGTRCMQVLTHVAALPFQAFRVASLRERSFRVPG